MRRFLTIFAILAICAATGYGIGRCIGMIMKKGNDKGYVGKPAAEIRDGVMTPETLLAFGRISDPQLSPDGKTILYGVSYTSVEDNRSCNNLFACDADGSKRRQLTRYASSVGNARWSADGKRVYFIQDGQIWEAPFKGKSLGRRTKLSEVENGVSGFAFSPDESMIMYMSTVPGPVKTAKDAGLDKANAYVAESLMARHWDHWVTETPHTFVARFDGRKVGEGKDILGADSPYELPTEPFGGLEQLSWSPDGRYIAYSCRKKTGIEYAFSTNCSIYVYDVQTGETFDIKTDGGYDTDPAWSPDGSRLAWISMERDGYEADRQRLLAVEMSGGRPAGPIVELTAKACLTAGGTACAAPAGCVGKVCEAGAGHGKGACKACDAGGAAAGCAGGVCGTACKAGAGHGKGECKACEAGAGRGKGACKACVTACEAPARSASEACEVGGYIYDVSGIAWTPDSRAIIFPSTIDAVGALCAVAADGSSPVHRLTPGDWWYGFGTPFDVRVDAEGLHLLTTWQSMKFPTEMVRVDVPFAGGASYKAISDENGDILSRLADIGEERITLKTPQGEDLHCWVLYPPQFDANGKYPAVEMFNGGPQTSLDQSWSYRWNFRLMAQQGYVVVLPNRHGDSGFGQPWKEQISGDYQGLNMQDYMIAGKWAKSQPWCTGVAGVGASYGGFSVYNMMGLHGDLYKCFISHAGIFDEKAMWYTTEEAWFGNWDNGGLREYAYRPGEVGPAGDGITFGGMQQAGAPYANVAKTRHHYANDPESRVTRWYTPLLCIHGEKDYRIPYEQGLAAFTAAQMMGVPSKLVIFPEENHWVTRPQNSLFWHRTFYDWLEQWMK